MIGEISGSFLLLFLALLALGVFVALFVLFPSLGLPLLKVALFFVDEDLDDVLVAQFVVW
jgi:hypothetical protein